MKITSVTTGLLVFVSLVFLSQVLLFGQEVTTDTYPEVTNSEATDSNVPSSEATSTDNNVPSPSGEATNNEAKGNEEIHMIRGDLETLKVYSLTRISVTNPDVADMVEVDSNHVLVLAKKAGQTMLFIWDEYGKRSVLIQVVDEDLTHVESRLRPMFKKLELKDVGVEVDPLEGKVVVSGKIPAEKKDEFARAIEPFGASIMNLAKEQLNEDLVQIDVQIAELSATLSKSLGIEWTSAVTYKEDPAKFVSNAARDIFKVGQLSRTTQILATVNALITEGKGRILSKPKLVVVNGKEASFQVGGQIPITTTNTTSGGNVQTNVNFKDYGITLTVTPTIKDGKINIILNVEVSDIDAANAVGSNVAFTTRNAQTQLVLENSQTVVIAGLIKHSENTQVKKVPFLGDIPIIGLAFRSRSTVTPNQETELVISLTPTIIPQRDSALTAVKEQEVKPADQMEIKEQLGAQEEAGKPSEGADPPSARLAVSGAGGSIKSAAESESSTQEVQADPASALAPASDEAVLMPKGIETAATPQETKADQLFQGTGIPESLVAYIQDIQKKIAQAIAYPYEAKEKGWEGTVKVLLRILRDGTLADATIKESSGYQIFDEDALNTAQILAPYGPFPSDSKLEDLLVTIPIVYTRKAAAQDGICQGGTCDPNIKSDQQALNQNGLWPDNRVSYPDLVQQRIAGSIVYPEEAREKGWEGTVKLALHILRDGTLAYASVQESSGYDLFDECALKTAKDLAPYSVFPPETQEREVNLTVPIIYSLNEPAKSF